MRARYSRRLVLAAFIAATWCIQIARAASIVDASAAETAFQHGDYKGARTQFDAKLSAFLAAAPHDATDHQVYREAEYLLDRLCDCSFTQRDWPRLKQYADSQWRIVNQDISVCQSQLTGALDSGGQTTAPIAKFLSDQLDEALRLRQILQLKRSLALLLLDSSGSGVRGDRGIRLYQQLVLAMRGVLSVDAGAYRLDMRALATQMGSFETINTALPEQEMQSLWEKYRPPGQASSGSKQP